MLRCGFEGGAYGDNYQNGMRITHLTMPKLYTVIRLKRKEKQTMKYKVWGHTTVTVSVEVTANSEAEALEKAADRRAGLDLFAGNDGLDKIIGVDGEDESVSADYEISYDNAELIDYADESDEDDCESI
jgi:hypothetical protein